MDGAFTAARADGGDLQRQTISRRIAHFFQQHIIIIAAQQRLRQTFQRLRSVRDDLHDRRIRHQHMPRGLGVCRDRKPLQRRILFALPDLQEGRLAAAHWSTDQDIETDADHIAKKRNRFTRNRAQLCQIFKGKIFEQIFTEHHDLLLRFSTVPRVDRHADTVVQINLMEAFFHSFLWCGKQKCAAQLALRSREMRCGCKMVLPSIRQ